MWLKALKIGLPALIGMFLIWAVVDRFDQAGKVRELTLQRDNCIAVAEGKPGVPEVCPAQIAVHIRASARAAICEQALAGRDLYAIRAACSEQVKRAVAERDAAIAERADLRTQLAQADARTADAVARAEKRATTTATRKADNDRTISTAPRTADGLVRCDADCLRRLSGEAGSDASRP
ncbi:hypothetical protein P1X14_16655 [Sphingomonas sp. AOB5]|uniref:hypothetical protein n=1 Tax=Sphingomonas sp. AOB5 TaxID=3034017 RepID=UPI0023FA19F3|nr:hypothetical protein [Sphingomonas sp. AOB5]MDF7776890.1 hypothetical protein [Sphingomonas sp. AOB5]